MSLKDEITTDPLGRGYSGMTDQQVADSLNAVDRSATYSVITGAQIFNATDDAEYGALTDAQKASWDALCAISEIDTASGVAKAREAELFGPGTQTRSNLQALRSYSMSRAQELGLGKVNEGDVKHARAS